MAVKCAHASCECIVEKGGPFGKYCSDVCRMKGDTVELRCECGHGSCRHG